MNAEQVRDLVEEHGGVSDFAKILGVSDRSVYYYLERGVSEKMTLFINHKLKGTT